jgi:hypothetical protein
MYFMKSSVLLLFLIAALYSPGFASAVKQVSSLDTNYVIEKVVDSVNINGQLIRIKLKRLKRSEPDNLELSQMPVSLIFVTQNGIEVPTEIPFRSPKNYFPKINVFFQKAQNRKLSEGGNLYVSFNTSYGGSGSTNYNYLISLKNGKIIMDHLFESSDELDYLAYSKNDDYLIFIEGIWGKGEAHYSDHRYRLKSINLKNLTTPSRLIGVSKKKYPSFMESPGELLQMIKSKEPTLVKSLRISNY